MFERYDESARRVLFLSRYAASELGSPSIETEHVLLGLLREPTGPAGRILGALPLDIYKDLKDRAAGREKLPASVEIPFSAGSKRVLRFAMEEADRLMHLHIGPEHLLLGLLREDESVAYSTLGAHGLRADDVRQRIVALVTDPSTPFPSGSNAEALRQIEHITGLVQQLGLTVTGHGEAHQRLAMVLLDLNGLRDSLAADR
jgi:ATP-dependent Clp protease ATP-binding subunit ClpC